MKRERGSGRSPIHILCLILVTLGLFGCDHASKMAAKATLEGAEAVSVAPELLHGALVLRYVENDDMAFSALRTLGVPRSPELLAGLAALALAGMIAMAIAYRRMARRAAGGGASLTVEPVDHMTLAGLALVLGGALGNIVDRLARGYVVDFIHVKGWPVFNVADIAVVVGVGLIALAGILRSRRAASVEP